ncbi:probable inactive poly [ADP-ribose] polymerase SRO5 [Olea europaea var. sylvestris]|uniref:probable inactive poly [ADP-ribose] polymerase SRO5 n=1 Tax=Olea europaea var. sylvestris TaxID=158386 RepID=UPI000C1D00E6|nr:probable inactive poly [ADP-ribose] polymerase SRO5 [Olea europaea var. sylvestris]XP_022865136.1 probable inactive poly [ADP-ribose] polymerase SRO5 [Olea europaea var. sylvestris]XP_022865137.1 probable inactive poly [ADP-ribose] polymerase SRO5 [Olea europaea var. sylvestris]
MESPDAYSNQLQPSAQRKIINFTQFEEFSNNSKSGTNYEDQIHEVSSVSDCESGIFGVDSEQEIFHLFNSGLIRIHDEDNLYEIIKKKLVSSLSSVGLDVKIEAIHKNSFSGIMNQAKFQSFCVYLRATKERCGGCPNVKYAWYCASKNEIDSILLHGFGHSVNSGVYGHGIYLSPADHPAESIQMPVTNDDDGLRHLLLCRVILGRMEVVRPDSKQANPSSEEFDSGVDNLVSPRNYIVWSTRMNTHILPEFVISFRIPSNFKRNQTIPPRLRVPNSVWIPFPELINVLSKFLPPQAIQLIAKHHHNQREKKITRRELIQKVRSIAGDKLLVAIMKSYSNKMKTSQSSSSSN